MIPSIDRCAQLETGSIGIDHYLPDPAAPLGGIKGSGVDRELGPKDWQAT